MQINLQKKSIDHLPSWKIWNCNIERFFKMLYVINVFLYFLKKKIFNESNTVLSNYNSDECHIKPNKSLIVPNKYLLSSDDEPVFKKIKNKIAFSMPDMPTYESIDNKENLHLNLDSIGIALIALKDCSNNQDNSIIENNFTLSGI
ncbi:uncharacterized protein LOC126908105 [Daktulosphaira vitifoliae]|uniref:uncharacterized protein LOC126908105 n=1 Tax=Daktulosphaira vitifoliae TaxID=58002 RepID=UPI0021AAD058|nr:uncharacterized protein LOC126908105 [Daktulosphaira vitifoliae]